MTSMIQSYSQVLKDNYKYKKGRNVPRQDDIRTHVKAYKPQGTLLEPAPFSIKEAVKSDIRSVKYFTDGINGRGNDYSIGKINDIGIKLGALGIAGMLAASKGSPLSRGMEFVGLGCWVAAMSLWQKIAINTPLKIFKGVDLDLEYKNSAGHRKKFYQDPQYICWDLMSDEEIFKMGDKLGVPKTIKNRRKAIENKARQVATQGNTIGLLTAGLATPLIASLAADQIGKHVITPALIKTKSELVDKNRFDIIRNITKITTDENTLKFIDKNITETMTPEQKLEIQKLFANKTEDIYLKNVVKDVIDEMFTANETQNSKVILDKKFASDLTKTLTQIEDGASEEIENALNEIAKKYNNCITLENKDEFFKEMNRWFLDGQNNLFDAIDSQEAQKQLRKMMQQEKVTSMLANPETIKQDLMQMSKMLDLYNEKIFKDFKTKYWKNLSNSENSVYSKIWDDMSKGVLKAFGVDNAKLKEFAKNAPDAEIMPDTKNIIQKVNPFNILGNMYDDVLSSSEKLSKTMQKLCKVTEDAVKKNDEYIGFSLKYLDKIQDSLPLVDRNNALHPFAEKMNAAISHQRLNVLKNYFTANETAFFPIKTLCILKNSRDILKRQVENSNGNFEEVYYQFKNLLINSQSVDEFVNKLTVFKNIIKDDNDYEKFTEAIFASVNKAVENYLPNELTAKMNASTQLSKELLLNFSDGVHKVSLSNHSCISGIDALYKLNLYKYADEIFDISYNNPEYLANRIGAVVKSNDNKLKLLQSMISLSKNDIDKIKVNDFSPIHNMLRGSSANSGYFDAIGRGRLRNILALLDSKDLADFGDISVIKTKLISGSKLTAPKLFDVLSRKAKDVYNYNRWFKRVGIAFLALCGVTALAISQTGKRNEFNPDVYQERTLL